MEAVMCRLEFIDVIRGLCKDKLLNPKNRSRRAWTLTILNYLYLFVMFLPLAFISLSFQQFVLALPSGFKKAVLTTFSAHAVAGQMSLLNLEWTIIATMFCAAGLLVFDRKLQTFWIIGATWGSACLLADTVIMPAENWYLGYAVNVAADLDFGAAGGVIYAWILTSIIAGQRTRKSSLGIPTADGVPLPRARTTIDLKAVATGYAGVYLLGLFWVFALLGTMLMVLVAIKINLSMTQFFATSGEAVTFLKIICKYTSVIVPLVVYILLLTFIRFLITAVLR
jgi:hypothetical protein